MVQGSVPIQGTASIPAFQFYKVEYGMGREPEAWNSIGEIRREPVTGGTLAEWNTSGFPSGEYTLRLTVVDLSGNFPQPCEVHVSVP